jgi:hypothetical protein
MDCRIFNNKLEDFQKGMLPKDIETTMEKHMEKCISCKTLYIQERDMNTSFSMYFNIDHVEQESRRSEIMKKIDVNRYGNSPIKKLKYMVLTNKKKYAAAAAVFLVVFLSAAFIKNMGSLRMGSAKSSSMKQESVSDSSTGNAPKNALKAAEAGITVNYYKVSKDEAQKMISETENVTKAVSSPDNKKKALVYGKGSSAVGEVTEEGYSKIVLQDLAKNEYYIIELNDKTKQLTAKDLVWRNNENILVIIGSAYGTVTRGGNVYNLNLNTGELFPIYTAKDSKTEVTKIKRGDEFHYILNISEYTDSNLMESKEYEENITLK